MLDLDSARVAKPLHFVWMWVLHLGQLELGAKFFTCEVMTTPSIDDDLDRSSIDVGLGMKDMASLVFFLVMLESQDLETTSAGLESSSQKTCSSSLFTWRCMATCSRASISPSLMES